MNYRKIWSDTFGPIIKGFHVHHITPKCEGGKDEIGNLIALHPDDHYLIHKMRGDRWSGAVLVMRNGHSETTKNKISKANLGGKRSDEVKKKMSGALKGRKFTDEHRKKISTASSGSNNGMFGKTPWNKGKSANAGVNNPNSRHSDDKKTEIIEAYLTGLFKQRELSEGFDVPQSTVENILQKFRREYYET